MIDVKDFILFLKRPNLDRQSEIISIYSFLKLIVISFFTILILNVLVNLIISTPLKYLELFPQKRDFNTTPYSLLKVLILAPVVEELIFRFPLRLSKIAISFSLSLILFLILNKISFLVAFISSILLFFYFVLLIKYGHQRLKYFDRVLNENFSIIFYFQALAFGFLHLTNYVLVYGHFFLFPLFIFNFILVGFFLGYIRIRFPFGLYVCITTHILLNGLYVLVHF